MSWYFLIGGILLLIVAYVLYSPTNFLPSVIIGAIGIFLLMLTFDRTRILLDRYQNR